MLMRYVILKECQTNLVIRHASAFGPNKFFVITPTLEQLIPYSEIDKLEKKMLKQILIILFEQVFLNMFISEQDMSGPRWNGTRHWPRIRTHSTTSSSSTTSSAIIQEGPRRRFRAQFSRSTETLRPSSCHTASTKAIRDDLGWSSLLTALHHRHWRVAAAASSRQTTRLQRTSDGCNSSSGSSHRLAQRMTHWGSELVSSADGDCCSPCPYPRSAGRTVRNHPSLHPSCRYHRARRRFRTNLNSPIATQFLDTGERLHIYGLRIQECVGGRQRPGRSSNPRDDDDTSNLHFRKRTCWQRETAAAVLRRASASKCWIVSGFSCFQEFKFCLEASSHKSSVQV